MTPLIAPLRRAALATLTAVATAVLLCAGTAAGAAPGDPLSGVPAGDTAGIRPAGTTQVVPDSYVVVLDDTATSVPDTARSLATRYGGRIGHTYRHALRGFEVSMTEAAATRLAADPAVTYVQRNGVYHVTETQANPPSWGLDRIDQRNLPLNSAYTYPTVASGVRVYVLDTGIRFSHNDFGGRASSGYDAIDGGSADDCHGHGTHVSGTVGGTSYGVAKGVSLIGVRVLNCSGSGTTAQVAAGIDWVTANAVKPAVANMSLGGGVDSTLDAAVANSIASGVAYAVAAGNNGLNACNYSPARVAAAITVGATTSTDARASYSNYGTCLDIFAPGSGITSAWYTSNTATNTISGTSMAAPHVAGAAAMVLAAHPSYTPQQVRDALVNDATAGVVTNPGTGSPNRLLYAGGGTPPADDFSISVSPTSGSTTPGGSVSATVGTAVTSGSAQPVTLSASGLPAGATASFTPPTVTAGNSATMTITTGGGTPAGTYPVTVTGTGSSATHSTGYSLTVSGGGGCTSPGQKLGNPGFESGNTIWSASSGVIGMWGANGQPPRTGVWDAWLDGYGTTHTDTLSQTVTLPAGCSSYTLSFWLHIDTAETTSTTQYDRLTVVLGGTTLATYSNLDSNTGYAQKSFDASAFAGQTVTLRFTGTEDFLLQTSFVIDDTALTVG